ncbi:helix-turn-helix, HxlR type [Shewanella denitrificans OS217]|uniref:Helix-turn-helix, HxlR type n=1 Tax=Shewanella denitrificans (strain OS217 / ATCC BAA-1090 / DSM 15013) TaxID=318161 RepID=Q12NC9_SHEDO|nr:helix-turn-helix domain-containing protein [Shewanella denitrificans]ABE55047.1 helix-turn-helix, HxlR type [Shewanella denitrificans OS217]
MKTPLPKTQVRGSNSGVAIMAVFDLLGRKWNMRILWELNRGSLSFRGLQACCDDMSPSVLNTRIKQLTTAELLCSTPQGYQLTDLGLSLMVTLDPLREWSAQWEASTRLNPTK